MRLSRTISSNVNDHSARGEEGGDGLRPTPHATLPGMTVTGEVKADADLPAWQSAFILGPNVRFTRTPESAYARRHSEPPVSKQEDSAPLALQPATAPVADAMPSVPQEDPSRADLDGAAMRRIEGTGRVPPAATAAPTEAGKPVQPPANVAGAEDDHGALALYLRLKREMAEANRQQERQVRSATADRVAIAAKRGAVAGAVAAGPSTRPQQGAFSLPISDHALFDTICGDVDLAGFAPAPRLPVPTFHAGPDTAAFLYREVSLRGRSAGPVVETTPARTMPGPAPTAPAVRTVLERATLTALPQPAAQQAVTPQPAASKPVPAIPGKPGLHLRAPPRPQGTLPLTSGIRRSLR